MNVVITWRYRREEAPECYGPWRSAMSSAEMVAAIEQDDAGVPFQVERVATMAHPASQATRDRLAFSNKSQETRDVDDMLDMIAERRRNFDTGLDAE